MRLLETLGSVSLLTLAAVGCGGSGPPEEVALEIGFLQDGVYQPLQEEGDCKVLDAPQGGFWVMPTVRTWGTREGDIVGCSLYDNDLDMELGSVEYDQALHKSDEGDWLEAAPFLLPLPEVDRDLFPTLEGHQGQLDCYVVAGDVEEHVTFDVGLVPTSLF